MPPQGGRRRGANKRQRANTHGDSVVPSGSNEQLQSRTTNPETTEHTTIQPQSEGNPGAGSDNPHFPADHGNAPSVAAVDHQAIIATFDTATLRRLLLGAARLSPTVANLVIATRDGTVAAENTWVIDFDQHSKFVWRTLADGDSMSSREAFDASADAVSSIEDSISTIAESSPAHASFGTKKSALVTLRKIGKSVAIAGPSEMAKQVRQDMGVSQTLEDAMLEIVGGMKDHEKQQMREDTEWIEKMEELIELAKGRYFFESLGEVLHEIRSDEVEGA